MEDIVDYMPFLLEACDNEVPYSVQVGYAMWTVRSILGAPVMRVPSDQSFDADWDWRVLAWRSNGHRYPSVETAALAHIILEASAAPPISLKDRRTEQPEDQPRIRAHFLQSVDFVLKYLNADGTCRVRNKRGELHWTGNPHKIAAELNVLPSAVRQAQAQLQTRKTG